MKPLKVLFFSLLYFLVYFTISLGIDLYFGLETSIPELVVIGLFFDILLIVLLVFDIPEKIVDKLSGNDEEIVDNLEEIEDFEEPSQKKEEKVEEVIPPQIVEQTPEKVEELY